MLFLIDFENVRVSGMKGSEWLEKDDWIVLFYSGSAHQIENWCLEQIERSECRFDLVKLAKNGKNALDFYIASHLGRLYGEGYRGKAAIISKDSGFSAVRDYWHTESVGNFTVYLAASIETAIISAGGKQERVKILQKEKENIDITVFYSGYQERIKLRNSLKDIFEGTKYQSDICEIQRMIEQSATSKTLYLDSLKKFGREDGLVVYRKIKEKCFCVETG